MLKVFQIVYNLAPGGAEHFVVDLCNELSNNPKLSITLITIVDDCLPGSAHYLPELSNKVKYVCLKTRSGFSAKSFISLLYLLVKEQPDVVHAHCGLPLLFLPALFLRKIKFIHTLHSIANKEIPFTCLKKINKLFYDKLVTPVTISKSCDVSYQRFYQLNNSQCIYNGRSVLKVTSQINDVREEVKAYMPNLNCPVYIHVARYATPKNQAVLINSFLRLEEEGESFLLLVLGPGHENAPYFKHLRSKQIKILGLKSNVVDYLSCADFFVLTSIWEGLPISLLEAMSLGCVPLCTPVGGIVDVITNEHNGFLAKSCKINDVYDLIKNSLSLKSINFYKMNVIEDYVTKYSIKQCADLHSQLYF